MATNDWPYYQLYDVVEAHEIRRIHKKSKISDAGADDLGRLDRTHVQQGRTPSGATRGVSAMLQSNLHKDAVSQQNCTFRQSQRIYQTYAFEINCNIFLYSTNYPANTPHHHGRH